MRILDQYLSRKFLGVIFFALVAFITIFVVVDLVEKLDAFIKHDVPSIIIMKFYLYSMPYIVVLTLPVAMLLASLFSTGDMARRNEITAMKTSGLSLYRILLPIFIISFIISLFAMVFGEYVVPRASEKREYLNDEYLEKERESWRKRINNVYMRDDQDRRISMRYFHAATLTGSRVSIKKFNGEELVYRLDAQKIVWADSQWVIYNGYERTFANGQETAEPFEQKILENENLRPKDFAKVLKRSEEMSYKELKAFIHEIKINGGNPDQWLVDLYLKISVPFASFIIVLFGSPLSSQKRRGGAMSGFGISLAICFVYFGIIKTFQTMGHNGHFHPLFAAWIANIIFAVGGIVALIKAPK